MPDFHDTRRGYAAARATAAQDRTALLRAKEQVVRLTRAATALARRVGSVAAAHRHEDNVDDNRADATPAGQLRALHESLSKAKDEVAHLQGSATASAVASLAARGRFAKFTDPIQGVSRLPDDVPVALFPLRLETRFKTIARNGVTTQMLWVRALPA